MKKITLLLAIICTLGLFAEQKNGIVYVKAGATGSGASWSDALGNIQDAVTLAKSTTTARKDVWVSGNFTISTAILMADSVNVYGSFAGTETDLAERAKVSGGKPWEFMNASVLTGNGSRIVETSQGSFDMETLFEGFTLTNGTGVGTQLNNSGGAAVVRGNMTLLNCIVKNSITSGNGGGVNMTGGTLRKCWIYGNTSQAGTTGGGGINANPASPNTATIEDCQINDNFASVRGGGVNIQGTGMSYCTNLKIFNNRAMAAGAVYKGGGAMYFNSGNNTVKNCLIYNNSGATAIYANGGNFYNNTIVKNVGGFYFAGGTINAINNIVWGCATDSTGTNATGLTGTTSTAFTVQNNATYNPVSSTNSWITADNILFSSNISNGNVENPADGTVGSGPKFNHVTRYIGATNTSEEILQLDSVDWSIPLTSPCVNTGKLVAAVTTDFTGLVRPQGYPKETALMDIGAYELPYYTVVVGEPATANGEIYSSLGVLLTENTSSYYAKGSTLEILFQPKAGHSLYRAYYTASNDGGLTFTGAETDITSQIGTDGFWTGIVNSNFKISVEWDKPNALSNILSDKIKYHSTGNGVKIIGLEDGQQVSIYSANGMLVANNRADGSDVYFALTKGLYVLRVDNSASKFIVR